MNDCDGLKRKGEQEETGRQNVKTIFDAAPPCRKSLLHQVVRAGTHTKQLILPALPFFRSVFLASLDSGNPDAGYISGIVPCK